MHIEPITEEQVKELTVQIPNMPVLYFNHSRLAASNFDLRLYFGQGNITAQGQQSFVEQLCVILTPEFARVLVEALTSSLGQFEQRFGKIRGPLSQPLTLEAKPAESEKKKKKR